MAKKKGKPNERKRKKVTAKADLPKGKRKGAKTDSRRSKKSSGVTRAKPSKSKPSRAKPPKRKPTPAKKSPPRKAEPNKKTSQAQKRARKPSGVSARGRKAPGKNQKVAPRTKARKRPKKPFAIPKRKRSTVRVTAESSYIKKATKKLPKKAKTIRKVLVGSKDKSKRSEFFGKRFQIKKTIRIYKPKPIDSGTFDFLVRKNIRVLKINGKTDRKAYIKAMYRDAQGNIRWASTTRESLKTREDVEDKVRLLISMLKAYGDIKFLGYETELVEDEWDADEFEDMGDSEV